jgi:enolase-phosphatase E1
VIRAVVTDIEGTTSSIDFVFKVLFPYARAHLRAFLLTYGHEHEVRRQLEAVSEEAGRPLTTEQAAEQLERWIDEDRKATPLKALQGMVWAQGYHSGELTGHVYPDAAEALQRWKAAGLRLYVYSSGSVQAQKLLFAHTDGGDLTNLFDGYFDTTTGPKRDADSYRTIAAAIGLPADDILFLSDAVDELQAARAAGMHTVRLVRDGTTNATAAPPEVARFDEIKVLP